MRIVTVALGSFTLGAVVMFFWGNHTSTSPQSVLAQGLVAVSGAVPVVPPLRHIVVGGHGTVANTEYPVDGLETSGLKFVNVTFKYGGGAYKLENVTVTPPVNIRLSGAAANTFAFLTSFGLVGCPNAQPPRPQINPNEPILRKASLNETVKTDLISPYGQ